jgi:hypothetical protein
MFLILLSASLTFGAGLLATAIYTEGALLALRTASEFIGWSFVLATLTGLMGLRRVSLGPICAASVTLCSGLAVLYISYFLEWNERPSPAIRHAAAAETLSLRPVAYQVIEPVMRKEVRAPDLPRAEAKPLPPRRKVVASAQPVSLAAQPVSRAAGACSALAGVESLQCNRCAEQLGFSWVMCQERVRLEWCASAAGDERTCPSPIPHSHPG